MQNSLNFESTQTVIMALIKRKSKKSLVECAVEGCRMRRARVESDATFMCLCVQHLPGFCVYSSLSVRISIVYTYRATVKH